MNIFFLDTDPRLAAQYHFDIHVGKMVLESAQLLSTAHHELKSPISSKLYRPTHVNHPCSKWLRESSDNYMWLYELYTELHNEFMFRRGTGHNAFLNLYQALSSPPDTLPSNGLTLPPTALPDHLKGNPKTLTDVVEAYRRYYIKGKPKVWRKWTNRKEPSWMT